MKMILRYQTEDGKIFDDAGQAQKYEDILKQAKAIPFENYEDDTCSFANGGGYIQQKKEVVEFAKKELVRLANEWLEPSEPFTIHSGSLGRYLDDGDMKVLNKLYSRLHCIDSLYREWGQPYYAFNPNAGQQVQLNS